MKKLFIFLFLLGMVSRGLLEGQPSTGSLYSAMGLGTIDGNGSGKTRLLGGTGIALPSVGYLNNSNPASFGAIEDLKFMFEAGFEGQSTTYTTSDLQQQFSSTNFNYLAMGFQFNTYWKSSIGLKPFSHVGYNITTSKYIEGTTQTYDTYFTGSGDVTQLYWSHAFVPINNLSLGINVSYLFGSIQQEESVIPPVTYKEEVLTRTKYVKSFYTDFGVQYTFEREKMNVTLGAIYGPGKQLGSKSEFSLTNSYDTIRTETVEDATKYSLPQKAGAGISVRSKNNNFVLSLDYRWEDWENVKLERMDAYLKNSNRYSLGMELVPQKTLNDPYLRRIRYMLGAYYNDSNIKYKGTAIQEMGMNLGFGLPLRGGTSSLYFGFEGGQKGSTNLGLVRENFYKFNVSFTLSDTWFQKHKFK